MTPQETVERCLALSRADACVVLVDENSTANLRWANNTLTTNGVTRTRSVTVVAVSNGGAGASAGVLTRSAVTADSLEPLVRAAEQAARDNGPADDAQPLVSGDAAPDWDHEPGETSIAVFGEIAPALGEVFGKAKASRQVRYGYVEHDVTTTYLGSSSGLRLRHEQPTGHIGITGKSSDLTRSAWVGQASRDLTDVGVTALDAELTRKLGWAQRKVELPAGRYDTVLPPTAVADLLIYAFWMMSARDAYDGRTVYSNPGKGTRVGEQLTAPAVSLWSDPSASGLECAPFVLAHTSGSHSSVFDNGLGVERTEWISDGSLAALLQTRRSAELTGLPVTPVADNLGLTITQPGTHKGADSGHHAGKGQTSTQAGDGQTSTQAGAPTSTDELVAGLDRGLLLTCLWYIREVDPQTLLLTGLTRDGVYLVEGGEIVGAVNNFRFNESPVALLGRFSQSTATVPAFSREWGDYFPRTAMPALRVPDFNMSSTSQAS